MTKAQIIEEATRRREEIASLYKEGLTLEQIGTIHNISRERVRQIIERYERENNTRLPRKVQGKSRITWRCKDCGVERLYIRSYAKTRKRCKKCHSLSLRKGIIEDSELEKWIAHRLDGIPWKQISNGCGYNRQNIVELAVFAYLRRNNRISEVPAIWKGYSTRWMARIFRSHANILRKNKADGRSLGHSGPRKKHASTGNVAHE